MPHAFEAPLAELREQLLRMSSLAERTLSLAIRALMERDTAPADAVEVEDDEIDRLEVLIDELVINYMATRGPVATDCRLMMCASKISSNLERIGDEATTIARQARKLCMGPPLRPLTDIVLMAETAQEMLRDGIGAFISGDAEATLEIIARDKAVDALNRELVKELTQHMARDTAEIERCLQWIRAGKALERAADHASNIAEEVYYLYRARDIRHGQNIKQTGTPGSEGA
jgi:phosphate transport system protein